MSSTYFKAVYSWKFSLKHKCFQNPGLRFNLKWMNLQLRNKWRQDCVSKFLAMTSSSSELRSRSVDLDLAWSSFNFFEAEAAWLLLPEEMLLLRITRFLDLKFIATEDWPRLAMMLPFLE